MQHENVGNMRLQDSITMLRLPSFDGMNKRRFGILKVLHGREFDLTELCMMLDGQKRRRVFYHLEFLMRVGLVAYKEQLKKCWDKRAKKPHKVVRRFFLTHNGEQALIYYKAGESFLK